MHDGLGDVAVQRDDPSDVAHGDLLALVVGGTRGQHGRLLDDEPRGLRGAARNGSDDERDGCDGREEKCQPAAHRPTAASSV